MSSIASMKANATIGPTPGTLIRRQHTGERRANSLSCSSSQPHVWDVLDIAEFIGQVLVAAINKDVIQKILCDKVPPSSA